MRLLIDEQPFLNTSNEAWIREEDADWPAHWINHPEQNINSSSVAAYKLRFNVKNEATIRINVSADQRYMLFVDGKMIGRGPERGNPQHWYFETYELTLSQGSHIISAMSWWLEKDKAPMAQMTIQPGFILAAEKQWDDILSTGKAEWQTKLIDGVSFIPGVFYAGHRFRFDGNSFPWNWENGSGSDWIPARIVGRGYVYKVRNQMWNTWLLNPAALPPMIEKPVQTGKVRYLVNTDNAYPVQTAMNIEDKVNDWHALLNGSSSLEVEPNSTYTIIIDLENYYCAYPFIKVSGGKNSEISLRWAESLYEADNTKGNRNKIEEKRFKGFGDEYILDGGDDRLFTSLWWSSGRYIEIKIKTSQEPLTFNEFYLSETRYPLENESSFSSSDPRLESVIPIAVRSLQMCSHETYMDCPYYEQLMYIGDSRLQALLNYVISGDDRQSKKALKTFDYSRLATGFTASRFPSMNLQLIPTFSLWWVCMLNDFAYWKTDMKLVSESLPGVRNVMESFRILTNINGLIDPPSGWNFTDWVSDPNWLKGVAPKSANEPSSIINLQYALALLKKAELEEIFGELLLAERDKQTANKVVETVIKHFWKDEQGLFADDLAGEFFSEHAQCLAVLTGVLPENIKQKITYSLLNSNLARTTIYFTHYLFETYYALGCVDKIFDRLSLWFELEEKGFKTTFEFPEPSRSDCHAWSAHPLYHYFASILGIRPSKPGFAEVNVFPQLGKLTWVEGKLPHPQGTIHVRLEQDAGGIKGFVILPPGVNGQFKSGEQSCKLHPGKNII